MNMARELWNMLENKWLQQGMEIMMPSIKVNKKIWIPMCDTVLTRENICSLPNYKQGGSPTSGWKKQNQILLEERLRSMDAVPDEAEAAGANATPILRSRGKKYNPETHV